MKTDKITHALIGAAASAWVSMPAYLTTNDLFTGLWVALWVAIIAGAIKEFCDTNTDGNKWDWRDFLATVVGGVLVALLILGMHYGRG